MSKKPKPPPQAVYVAVNRDGGFVGVPCQTEMAVWGWMVSIGRPLATMKDLKAMGYTVHKYILEEPCQNK